MAARLGLLFSAALIASTSAVAASSPFDGTWNVSVQCAQAADGAEAYNWSFPAQVRNGFMRGQRGAPGGINSSSISGQIKPDGSALLAVSGRTGRPEYSVGRVAPGHPFHFTVTAHFDARSGSGKRNELRPCNLAFSKE